MNLFKRIINWYFSRNSLPYWCIMLNDFVMVAFASIFTYWAFRKSQILIENYVGVFYTALLYGLISCVSSRVFRTYNGILRFSSFVDLRKVAYANMLNIVIAVILSEVLQANGITSVAALTQTETLIAFILATLAMWVTRIIVKTLYDIAYNDNRAQRVLIYGAMTGGVGLAKNIGMQRPRKFKLCGFISHDKRAKHILLMGKNVYNDIGFVFERSENMKQSVVLPPHE